VIELVGFIKAIQSIWLKNSPVLDYWRPTRLPCRKWIQNTEAHCNYPCMC